MDFSGIVERYGPAVVNISTTAHAQRTSMQGLPPGMSPDDPFAEFFKRFMPQVPQQRGDQIVRGLGSGFIVSADGLILTNAHVVDGAQEVNVKLTDRREFKAKVLGVDKQSDVAVLRISANNLPVVQIGNPANTNAYIAMKSAPDLPRENFTAMLRLDHNRALSQIAAKTGKPVSSIEKLFVWGNHSPTMYADYRYATIDGKSVKDMINDPVWNNDVFLPTVGKRGAAIIEARGLSSAASAAGAAIDHVRDWLLGSNGKIVTMGIPSNGDYGIPQDVMFGFPVTTANGKYEVVKGLEIDEYSQGKIKITLDELEGERAGVQHLLG